MIKYFAIAFFSIININAQSIQMEFPAFAGKSYEFKIFQGEEIIVDKGIIPPDGKFTLSIPEKYTPYVGMSRWLLTDSETGGGLDMAIQGHGFKISCLSNQPNEGNINYVGYDAVNELNRLYKEQQLIIDKFETMSKATMLYDKTHPSYPTFTKEQEEQVLAFEKFQQALKVNTNYNARFLPIVNLTTGIAPKLTDNYDLRAEYVNDYIVNELNYDELYTSGHWTAIIYSWVQMHTQMYVDKARFVKDFVVVSKKLTNPVKYTDWIGKVTYYLTEFGKDDYIEAIAPTVLASGKVNSYEGKTMQVYVKAMIGSKAPDLIIKNSKGTTTIKSTELKSKQTLLLFYKSGCGPCETTLENLKTNYTKLINKGLKIIAFSSDTNETEFKTTSATFPWKDTFCDLEGMNGINFKNYAVIGTPTMYLLDSKGIILKKLATVEEILK